jgi:stearoyl-CoA desaturase (Delta-9 desaturase)
MKNNRKTTINWTGALFLILTPPAAVIFTAYHLYHEGFVWQIWALAAAFYTLTACSITGGYHRYFSHRTYEAQPWVKWFWALFGAAAFQNSILIWARDHRVHHRFVDTEKDPYSINKGFFYAHFGWMMVNEEPLIPLEPYGRDLERDPIVKFQHDHYVTIAIFMGFALPTICGWALGSAFGGLAVAGFLRIVTLHHMTFFINSWAHYFGKQTYTDTNTAKDSLLMAFATFGEGYHNFHHIFANDYRNGVRWYHWDPTKWIIQAFRLLGGASNLQRTPWSEIIKAQMQMEEKRLKSRLNKNWQAQFQQQLDSLKARVEQAYARIEKLREEYKQVYANYAAYSMERIREIKLQIRLAKIEFDAAIEAWRAYNSFLKATARS